MDATKKPSRRRTFFLAAVALVVLGLPPYAVMAGKFNRALEIGGKAPDWSGLIGVDGRKFALSDFADAKLVVMVFTCNHCPVATANQARLIALQEQFRSQGVRLLAICSNQGNEDSLPAMRKRAEAEGYNFPYISDADQTAAKSYGARHTPTAFVLDGDRKVRYMGAIDDNWQDASQAKRNYLRDAIESLLAGERVPFPETRPIGCEIPLADTEESSAEH